MKYLCMIDFQIEFAHRNGTLTITKHWSERFQDHYWVIGDEMGMITNETTEEDAKARVAKALEGK